MSLQFSNCSIIKFKLLVLILKHKEKGKLVNSIFSGSILSKFPYKLTKYA